MYCLNRMNISLIFDLGMMLEVGLLEFGVNLGAISALLKAKKKKRKRKGFSSGSGCSDSGLQLFHADD